MKMLYGFLFIVWVLILIGGGVAVIILGPISISGFGDFDQILSSLLKGGLAIVLVVVWVVILSKLKNWILTKQFRS